MTDMSNLSKLPCETCGVRHELDTFKPYAKVIVIATGRSGSVLSWSQYGGPIYVRIRFDQTEQEERENFDPCELRLAAPHARPLRLGAVKRSGAVICREMNGNLRISKAHDADSIIIERADIDDLMVALDGVLGERIG